MTNSFVYGHSSQSRLSTCHPLLQDTAQRALRLSPVDIAIVWGWRDAETQESLYRMKASKVQWPNSKHNHTTNGHACSLALDFAPYVNRRIDWNDTHAFALVAGVFFAAWGSPFGARRKDADGQQWGLRWGGDWDRDGQTTDQTFMDWGHIEMVAL